MNLITQSEIFINKFLNYMICTKLYTWIKKKNNIFNLEELETYID
jgi:hypothetical protein